MLMAKLMVLFLALSGAVAQPVYAQSSIVDKILKEWEEDHLEAIEYNRKEHFTCPVGRAKTRAASSRASEEAIVAYTLSECRSIEVRLKDMLLNGPHSISGGMLALPMKTVLKIVDLRKKSLREEILATITSVR